MVSHRPNRRNFLKRALSTTAIATVPVHGWFPGRMALGASGSSSPNERIQVAHIGLGGRGSYLLGRMMKLKELDVVGVSDVDLKHLQGGYEKVWRRAQASADYRRLLDNRDVEAVVIASPDHWHCKMAVEACQAGKDVYVEKPTSTFVEEGRRMVEAARAHERVVQVGIHHRSNDVMREIVEMIRSGRIGKVHTVKTWMWEHPFKELSAPGEPPLWLDYDQWLGPAPRVPYHPDGVHFNFRWRRDYAGGYMTDWGVHMLNVVTHAMDVDRKGPKSVEAWGRYAPRNLYDFPMSMEARWEFNDPDFTLTWTQPSSDAPLADRKYGMNFHGEAGELRTYFHGYEFFVDGKSAELPAPRPGGVDIGRSPGHIENWVECMRSRKSPVADIEVGHRTTSLCLLGNVALDAGRKLVWDWESERFPDDQDANGLLSRHGSGRA